MRSSGSLVLLACVLSIGACGDPSGSGAVPTSIEIVSAPPANAAAGVTLPASPTFVVKDQDGNAMGGVAVTVAVTAGGGTITNAPTSSASGPTSVGEWRLGNTVATNSLTITVSGLPSVTMSVSSLAGAVARIVALTSTDLSGTVGQGVSTLPGVRVTDAFDNPITGAVLTVSVSGGGSVSTATITSNASGLATLPDWTLGTVKGSNTVTLSSGTASAIFTAMAAAGPLQSVTVAGGADQVALAGTVPTIPIRVSPIDQYGNTLDNQTATLGVVAGDGSLSAASATSGAGGVITVPAWTLGKSAVPQQLLVTVGTRSMTVNATVRTSYVIDVRFWGDPMTPEQQAFFTTAAARLRGAVVGELPAADVSSVDPEADCGVTGVAPPTGSIPGVIIYASIQNIDGKGQVLARAGPCVIRSASDYRTAVGIMEFDVADINSLAAGGSLVDVITHEMLHVVGIGTFWQERGLLQNAGTSTVAYRGPSGVQGCRENGGTTTCASTVPVENTGGPGTAGSHWRESVFANELMTGFINAGSNPLSVMTVRSLEDLGYSINPFSSDAYIIAIGSLRDGSAALVTPMGVEWERGLSRPPRPLPRSVAPRKIR